MKAATRTWLATLLLAVHGVLLLLPLRRTYITVDEVMNVAAGLSYWKSGRFFVYRVNPPLTKLIAVVPALAAAPEIDVDRLRDDPTRRAEFSLGLEFTERNRARIFDLVCLSRLAGVLWSLWGGWLVYRWSGTLYGGDAGLLALSLWAFDPLFLGHAGLVMADVPAAVAGLAASYAFWRYLQAPSWGGALVAGAALGLAESTKFTLVVLAVLWPAVAVVVALRAPPEDGRRTAVLSLTFGHLAVMLGMSLNVVNLGYLGSGTGTPLGEFPFVSKALGGRHRESPGMSFEPGNRFRESWLGAVPVPLPADYVRGVDVQRFDFEHTRLSYLGGVWRDRGWAYYYLYALLVKLPLGTLALLLWGVAAALRPDAQARRGDTLLLLATGGAIVALVSSQTGFTQHARYVIPALPYPMIVAGGLAGERTRNGARRLAWGLAISAALSSLWVYPHSLSYFNEAAGGPCGGHRHLVDSNIDWGQDLVYLKEWLDAHPEARPLKLAYYNFKIDPSLLGIEYELPPPGPAAVPPPERTDLDAVGPQPGHHAVSVNYLRGAVFPIPDGRGGFREARPHEFEYFREFRPIARAGYSIYIYRISPAEADAARRRLGLKPIAPRGHGTLPHEANPGA